MIVSKKVRQSAWVIHACTLLLAAVGVFCADSTRRSLSGTFDEPNHLAAGLEWWQFGTYTQWTENPPLARIAIAALPYLHGMRLPPHREWDPKTHDWDRTWQLGNDLLYASADGYETTLVRARLGILPFFLICIAVVWGLAGGRRRPLAGLLAVGLTATLPALIAHGALATTDIASVATYLLAVLALLRWFERATTGRALAVGVTAALALLAKFSMLLFLPATAVAFIAARRMGRMGQLTARPPEIGGQLPSADPAVTPVPWRVLARQAGLAAVAMTLVTWAGYHFSVGAIGDLAPEVKGWLHLLPPVADRGFLYRVPLPMPELFHGIRFLRAHNAVGHNAYLLGKVSDHGFAAFYPVALFVKTPLPFLGLFALAAVLMFRRRPALWAARGAALAALAILGLAAQSHINLGIRHVLVVLPLLALSIVWALDDYMASAANRTRRAAGLVLAALLVAQLVGAVRARRTELGYFNALAGADPAAILLDSDLDWGQDLFELRRLTRERGIDTLKICFFGMLRVCRHGLPPLQGLVPGVPATGWIAISENYYRHRSTFVLLKDPCDPKSTYSRAEIPPAPFAWLGAHTPVAIAGTSIRLYHIQSAPTAASPHERF